MMVGFPVEKSEICEYYRAKHIMLTGATGLMGKLIIEKLLRTCKPAMIYLLVRSKNSKNPQDRLKGLTENQLFNRLREEDPEAVNRLKIICGDVSAPGLALSPADVQLLVNNVQIVIHGAATVKFNESLFLATKINVLGTKAVLELCTKMRNLESVVHISTAYSHCPRKEIKEEFYKTPMSPENLIKLTECCSPEVIDMLSSRLLDKWANTYVFTKAVAEQIVRESHKGLPIAIFRPGIILTTRSDPLPNWIDQLYGPIGIAYGCSLGLIHVIRLNKEDRGEFLPADMTVNCLLAIGYKTATLRQGEEVSIYNFTSNPENPATWGQMFRCMKDRASEIPSSQTFWYYSIVIIRNRIIYYIVAFFLHTLPALLVDICLILLFKKPRALETYKKIHNVMDLVGSFSTNTWKFSIDNTIDLWKSLNVKDRQLFDFDMASLDYESFLRGTIDGVMVNFLKEDEKKISYRKRRYFMLYLTHKLAQLVICVAPCCYLWRLMIDH